MSHTQNSRRFKANPIEVLILSAMSAVFFNSIYNLFYDHDGFQPKALVAMTGNPISEGRSLASASSALMTLEVECNKPMERGTPSNRIRLNGPLCGADPMTGARKLIKANITNNSNQYIATVFSDVDDNKFSTDYIPLENGKNTIHIEFSYIGGETSTQDIIIDKEGS